ncbi:hypothetical protein ISCGN_010349 [Ixodes scapularis]
MAYLPLLTLVTVAIALLTPAASNLTDHEDLILASLESSAGIHIVLLLQELHLPLTSSWARFSRLPFPVQVWNRFGTRETDELVQHSAIDRKVVVLVPSSTDRQRRAILEHLEDKIGKVTLARLLFLLGPGEHLPFDEYPEVSCVLISVNDSAIDVPQDSFRNCLNRRRTSAETLFSPKLQGRWSKFRDMTITGITHAIDYSSGRVTYDYAKDVPSMTLKEALLHLNVTIQNYSVVRGPTPIDPYTAPLLGKDVDMVLLRLHLNEERRRVMNVDAHTIGMYVGFYSARGTFGQRLMLRFDLQFGCVAAAAVVCAFAFVIVNTLRGKLSGRSTDVSNTVLFLYGSFFGRGASYPPFVESSVIRFLSILWLAGMFFLGNYIQSAITSESSVPIFKRAIETTEDVAKFVDSGRVMPCVTKTMYTHFFEASPNYGVLRTIHKLLRGCGDSCLAVDGWKFCTDKARQGTHVILDAYNEFALIHEPGVSLGKDFFCHVTGCFPVAKSFPFAREYRQLTTAILEGGLYERLLRSKLVHVNETEASDHDPFQYYMLLYLGGCSISAFSLILECIVRARSRARGVSVEQNRKIFVRICGAPSIRGSSTWDGQRNRRQK